MPARPALYPELLAWECLDAMAAAYPFSRSARRERIHQVIDAVGLHDQWDRPVQSLFARERVLLAFALAILPLPDVLLLDEPAADSPAADIARMGRLIAHEAERGAAVLIACESLARWEGVCDGVIVLARGRVVTRGETGDLRRRAGVTGHVVVRLAENGAAHETLLAHLLRGSPLVHEVHEDGKGAWVAAYLGGHKQAAALLSALVAAGLPVSGFHFKADSAAAGPALDYTGAEHEHLVAP
jgi:ABC-2 type transport system ATP-binding protein